MGLLKSLIQLSSDKYTPSDSLNMSKTPIMILQEVGVKESILPDYTIITSQNGTHQNIFTYRVKYNNLCAEGTAPNKKQAKQNAAQNMLILLQQKNNTFLKGLKLLDSCNSNITTAKSSLPSVLEVSSNDVNYIGILQEYCIQNRLVEPEYQICEINGPPHNMTFKMSCTLGSLTEEVEASTKKQAKQQVARKVLQKLPCGKNFTSNSQCQPLTNRSFEKATATAMFDELGIEIANLKIVDDKHLSNVKLKYQTATSKDTFQPLMTLNETIPVDNYHLYLKSMIFTSICNSKEREFDILYKNFKSYVPNCDEKVLLFQKQALNYIKDTCKFPIKRISLTGKNNMTIIGFRINLIVPFTHFGISENPVHAEYNALSKTIAAIILYLK